MTPGAAPPSDSDTASITASSEDDAPGIGAGLVALVLAFAFAMALPILVILGSMPGGLISALIMLFGIQQAWKMTAGQNLEFHGPLTVAK